MKTLLPFVSWVLVAATATYANEEVTGGRRHGRGVVDVNPVLSAPARNWNATLFNNFSPIPTTPTAVNLVTPAMGSAMGSVLSTGTGSGGGGGGGGGGNSGGGGKGKASGAAGANNASAKAPGQGAQPLKNDKN